MTALPKPAKRPPRRSRPSPVRRTPRAALERSQDAAWSKAVRERDPVCCLCLCQPSTDAHHIFARARKATRWVLENGAGLCRVCHRLAHRFPARFHEVAAGWFGPGRYEALRRQSLLQGAQAEGVA